MERREERKRVQVWQNQNDDNTHVSESTTLLFKSLIWFIFDQNWYANLNQANTAIRWKIKITDKTVHQDHKQNNIAFIPQNHWKSQKKNHVYMKITYLDKGIKKNDTKAWLQEEEKKDSIITILRQMKKEKIKGEAQLE